MPKLNSTFKVKAVSEAEKHYNKLDDNMKRRVNKAIEDLRGNPFRGPNIKKFSSKTGQYRYRVGSYRIVYNIDKKKRICYIMGIHDHDNAYK